MTSPPSVTGSRSGAPHDSQATAIVEAIAAAQAGQALTTAPPQAGHSVGAAAAPGM